MPSGLGHNVHQKVNKNQLFLFARPGLGVLLSVPNFFWAGWWDAPREGTFLSIDNGTELTPGNYAPWGLGEPNGKRFENCAAVTENGMWKDFSCNLKTCAICCMKNFPVFTLRGS